MCGLAATGGKEFGSFLSLLTLNRATNYRNSAEIRLLKLKLIPLRQLCTVFWISKTLLLIQAMNLSITSLREHAKRNCACVYIKLKPANSLEKLQDSRDHLCYGVHRGILVPATDTQKKNISVLSSVLKHKSSPLIQRVFCL